MSVEVRPARVNTMAPEGKDYLLKVVRKERQNFYDLIDTTNDETWKTPTACTEWEVRDQVGHLVDVTEGYLQRFALARAKEPFPEPLGLPGMAGRGLARTQALLNVSPGPQVTETQAADHQTVADH